VFAGENDEQFTVFRHVVIKSPSRRAATPEDSETPEAAKSPEAFFVATFKPKNMTIAANKRFSLLPMMVFMGFTGFRSKMWMVDETTGLCRGVYEWQTRGDAEAYSRSIAVRFMTRRSEPGTVRFEIVN
jgi:hypothetical protein